MSKHASIHQVIVQKDRKRRLWVWAVLGVAILLSVVAGYCGSQLYSQARQVKAHETKALQQLGGFSNMSDLGALDKVASQLPSVQKETAAAEKIAHGSLWNVAANIPVYGKDITTVQGMTTVVNSLSSDSLPKLLSVITTLHKARLSTGNGQLNLQPILAAQKGIAVANAGVQQQVSAYKALPMPHLSMIKDAYVGGEQRLTSMADKVGQVSNAFQILPDFLGSGGARRYVVMAQTNAETRSAGGLIGSVGTLTTDNGAITVGNFRPNVDYIPYGASDPTADEIALFQSWGPLPMAFDIRDLAVYPDTSRLATGMKTIWQRTPWGNSQPIDGVMLVDPVFLQELVKISGNVTLSDGRVLTGNNTAEFLLNTVYKDYPVSMQDTYFGEVVSQSVAGMFKALDFSKLMSVTKAMTALAQGRHLSMYAFDSATQQHISAAGLTARPPSDERHPAIGVYVTQQNASKMDWYVHRSATVVRSSCNANGSQTYHVDYTMTNTLNAREVSSLPLYVIGDHQSNQPQGYGVEKTLIYPPAGGAIANLSVQGQATTPKQTTLDGKSLYASVATIAPGQSAVFSFDVTTSSKAISDLTVDQTPQSSTSPGITVDTKACTISK